MKNKIGKEDLLFHPAHGVCRVTGVTRQSGESSYELQPVILNRHSRIRFTIPQAALKESGFNKLISPQEAGAVLEYFKTGNSKSTQRNSVWESAVLIRAEAESREPLKFAKRRQNLDRAVNGLILEFAHVLKVSRSEIVALIQKNLGEAFIVNPLILTLFSRIENLEILSA